MPTFKPGQRVRIVRAGCSVNGKEATVLEAVTLFPRPMTAKGVTSFSKKPTSRPAELVYRLSIDGIGTRWPKAGKRIAFRGRDLRPLTDPGCDAMLRRLLRPIPLDLKTPALTH